MAHDILAQLDSGLRRDLIVRDPLATQVRRFITQRLSSGGWKPGDRVTIRSLAQELRISSTPVREVLLQLASTGCLELKQNTSFTVPLMSLDAYIEVRRLRVMLEGEGAAEASNRATPEAIDELARLQALHEAAEREGNMALSLERNRAFHLALVRMSGLPTLVNFVETLWLRSGPMLNTLYPGQLPWKQRTYRHVMVIAALRERDPDKARAAIEADIVEGGKQAEDTLRARS